MAIRDNKNGSFTIDYRDYKGSRRQETIYGSKTYAKEILNKRLTERSTAKYSPERVQQKITFREAANKYWELHGSKTKSAKKLRYTFDRIVDYFGDKPLAKISVEDMQVYYNTILERTSGSTANRYFTTVRAIISLMIKLRLFTSLSPCVGVIRKPENPIKTDFFTTEEIIAIVKAASERFRPFLICAITTGVRRGELMNLDWKNVDLNNNKIHIHIAKSGKSREVPLSEDARNLFLALGPKPEGKVFFLTEAMIRLDYKKAIHNSNVKHIPLKNARHTFASQFRIHRGNMSDLQQFMGHSTMALTMRYAHLSPEYTNESIKCINGLIPATKIQSLGSDDVRLRRLSTK